MIYFDVGANVGKFSIPIARYNSEAIIYAFEPVPELWSIINASTHTLSNYILTCAAVSNYNGTSTFNVSAHENSGCSSLLELSEKAYTEWNGRRDMDVTNRIEVDVIRLDNFIEKHNIDSIDYIKIDAQGSDLQVLEGMGKYLSIIKEGQVEAGLKTDILYKGQNTKDQSIKFLESNGFIVTDVELNDAENNEVNIFFRRVI